MDRHIHLNAVSKTTTTTQVVEEILEVIKVFPQERVSEFIVEQAVGVPVSQVMEDIAEVVRFILWSASNLAPFRRLWIFRYHCSGSNC